MSAAATKYAIFAATAAPSTEKERYFMNTATRATRRRHVIHCTAVDFSGVPSAVRQADDDWTSESVTAFTAIMRTSLTSSAECSAEREENIIFAASGANANSAAANGTDTAMDEEHVLESMRLAIEADEKAEKTGGR